MQKLLTLMLSIALPLLIVGQFAHFADLLLFTLSCLTIIPLAGIMGRATESIAIHSGPRIGGLVNATFGNAVELIIGFLALEKGYFDVVQASITGSVIGNLLLVAGLSFLVGGARHPVQRFNKVAATTNSSMMMLGVVIALVIPAIFSMNKPAGSTAVSVGVAAVSLVLYILGLYFSLVTHRNVFNYTDDMEKEEAEWGMVRSLVVLLLATLAVSFASEVLVKTIETVSLQMHWSKVFIGVIIVAIIGNAAEHSSAVLMAWKNRMDLALEIAVGSSLQIAMFVAPVLVFSGLLIQKPLPLVFSWPELAAMSMSVLLVAFLSADGESNWLEGAMALGAYTIMGIGFYYL